MRQDRHHPVAWGRRNPSNRRGRRPPEEKEQARCDHEDARKGRRRRTACPEGGLHMQGDLLGDLGRTLRDRDRQPVTTGLRGGAQQEREGTVAGGPGPAAPSAILRVDRPPDQQSAEGHPVGGADCADEPDRCTRPGAGRDREAEVEVEADDEAEVQGCGRDTALAGQRQANGEPAVGERRCEEAGERAVGGDRDPPRLVRLEDPCLQGLAGGGFRPDDESTDAERSAGRCERRIEHGCDHRRPVRCGLRLCRRGCRQCTPEETEGHEHARRSVRRGSGQLPVPPDGEWVPFHLAFCGGRERPVTPTPAIREGPCA